MQPKLEEAVIRKMETNLTEQAVRTYIRQFPEPQRAEKVEKILEKNPAVKRQVLPDLRKAKRLQQQSGGG